ncbi:MAG: hypothetical protein P8Y76_08245, partial [bacterium]
RAPPGPTSSDRCRGSPPRRPTRRTWRTPPTTVLIKKAAGIESGSPRPHTDKVGKITRKQAEEIARVKMPDLTAADLEAAVRSVAGSARSMGIVVEGL